MDLANALAAKAKKKEWEPLKYASDAITYSDGGDYQQAITWYKTALSVYDNLEMRMSLGDAYLRLPQGGGGEAADNYDRVVAKDPKNSMTYQRIGKLFYGARNYKVAQENWEKAKEADPNNPIPWGDLADAYTAVGNYEKAKTHIEKYVELSDPSDAVMEKYMDVLFLSKNYKDAAAKAQELINNGKTKPRYYGILAFSQYELKDSVNALKNARTYFEKQDAAKNRPDDYRMFAKILLQNSKGEEANTYFAKAVEIDSSKNKAAAYRDNAETLRLAKEWLSAAKWYERIMSEYPNDVNGNDYFYAPFCHYYGHEYDVAFKGFQLMKDKYPKEPSPAYWTGRAAAAIDNEAKEGTATPFYEQWLTMETASTYTRKPADLMQAYQYLLIYYFNKEDKVKAQGYVDKIKALEPDNALAKQIEDYIKSGSKTKVKPAGDAKPAKDTKAPTKKK
jgi:tetratricopeptide (TPR) repeat protein